MSLLVRKFDKAKWHQNKILEDQPPSADALTHCLKTTKNTLSTWKATDHQDQRAVLAIITTLDHIDTIHLVMLDEEELTKQQISVVSSEGASNDPVLNQLHRDLVNLNVDSMAVLARYIVQRFKQGAVKSITSATIADIVVNAVQSQFASPDSFREGFYQKCVAKIAARPKSANS